MTQPPDPSSTPPSNRPTARSGAQRYQQRGHSPFVEKLLTPDSDQPETPVSQSTAKQARLPAQPRLRHWFGPDWSTALVFMLPTALILSSIFAFPVISAMLLSFTNTHGYEEPGAFIGLQNYVDLWGDSFFRNSVIITLRYTVWVVFWKCLVGLGAALLLHHQRRFSGLLTGLILLPWIVPEVVRAVLWQGLLDPLYGVVNRLLLDTDLIERGITFTGSTTLALPTVILVNVWGSFPLFTVILLAGLKAIDRELYEAASIDGAGAWRQFLHITLPGLQTVLITVILLATIWSFNDFSSIYVLTRGGPLGATTVYSIRVYEAASGGRFGVGVAMAMTLVPVGALLIWLLSRRLVAGTAGQTRVKSTGRLVQNRFDPAWPLRQVGRWLQAGFWLINNTVETLIAKIRRGLGNLPLQHHRMKQSTGQIGRWLSFCLLGLLFFIELFPFYWAVVTSFKTNLQITTFRSVLWPEPWTLAQYQAMLGGSYNFATWYKNTLLLAVITPCVATFSGALGAYGLTRLRWRGRSLFASMVLVAYLLPGVLLLIPLSLIFEALGLLETLWPLVIAYPSFTLPFALWLMMGYYQAIPEELEGAGLIDGCTRFGVFYRIILPLVRPALIAIFLFGVTHAWGEFLFASYFRGSAFFVGDRLTTLAVALADMVASGVGPWGEVTATSILMALPVFVLYGLARNHMIEGLVSGAVKGGG